MKTYHGISAAIYFVFFVSVHCAPSSKSSSPQTVFDQKQTGDYNIQLHLKDFQIIALLAGDSGLGDYDYNYDYSDFTIKPSTQKPAVSTSPSSSPPSSSFPTSIPTSSRPSYLTQQPLLPSSSTAKPAPANSKPDPSTAKPLAEVPPPHVEEVPQKVVENNTSINDKNKTFAQVVVDDTVKPEKMDEMISPGKIKVQIIETPLSMSSVPGEENTVVNTVPQTAEFVPVRKCASGFTRDQKGRCRRVRKPGGSSSLIGFSRLANNIASKFVKDSTRATSVESA